MLRVKRAAVLAQLFQDRLEAVEVMLLQKPIVSGRYTGYAFRHFVLPLDPHFRAVWQRCAPGTSACHAHARSLIPLRGAVSVSPA